MGLTEEESKVLARLMKKKDQPDPTPASKALNISIDLGDEKQVDRARKLGLLDFITGEEDEEEQEDEEESESEDIPKRRGYFPEGKKK